jgi:hypothetical protein
MPLILGSTRVFEGETNSGFEPIEVYVTHETKEVLGVTCTVVRDQVWVNGELVEDTYDCFAQHEGGDVWPFGEDVKDYENGALVGQAGAWEAGVDEALPGVITKADPVVGNVYRQEYYAGEAEDMAEILALDAEVGAPYVDYTDCLQTKERTPLELRALEHEFYARGVGMVSEVVVRDGWGEIALVDVTTEQHPEASEEDGRCFTDPR